MILIEDALRARSYTQTKIVPETDDAPARGNCWQTCIAAILGLPIDELPDQVEAEIAGWSYGNALNEYLRIHHQKTRTLLYEWQLRAPIRIEDVLHVICGPSPRTAVNGVNHCIIGRGGEPFWDVHPSRDGLISVNEMQFIVPIWKDEPRYHSTFAGRDCICPACGGIPAKPVEGESAAA